MGENAVCAVVWTMGFCEFFFMKLKLKLKEKELQHSQRSLSLSLKLYMKLCALAQKSNEEEPRDEARREINGNKTRLRFPPRT